MDDHAFLRDALAEVLQRHFPEVEVVQTGRLDEAMQQLRALPEVSLMLLDLQLPDGDGLQALPALRLLTEAPIAVMSADARPETIRAALQAGAVGYLPKTLHGDDMVAALRQILAGGRFEPPMAPGLRELRDPGAGLSPRQNAVLLLLLGGASNKTIARELDISEATVKTHLTAIFGHFGVNSRTQVMAAMTRRTSPPGPRGP